MTACTPCPVFTLRRLLLAMGLVFVAMLGFGYYLQEFRGLTPCPMCIVQRYCYAAIAVLALLAAATPKTCAHKAAAWLSVLLAALGAFTAGRQSWLQWNPPEFFSCGRDPFQHGEQYRHRQSAAQGVCWPRRLHGGGLDFFRRLYRQLVFFSV